jgi:hypothetical protein
MTPKEVLLNGLDDLDLDFIEGENELEFEIDGYSFSITYSLYDDELYDEENEAIKGGTKLEILSINVSNEESDETSEILIDDEIQKLFDDYYYNNVLMDDNFKPLNVNFGEFSDFID